MMWTLYVTVFSILLCVLYAWPNFMNDIPNGRKVPNPCTSEEDSWFLVGHQFPTRMAFKRARTLAPPPAAGEPTNKFLNVFGEMYLANNFKWSAICQLDADGDGKTNGEELGDPTCEWSFGGTPAGAPTGHPGICEDANGQVCPEDVTKYCSTPMEAFLPAEVRPSGNIGQQDVPSPPIAAQGGIPLTPGQPEVTNPPPVQERDIPPPPGLQEDISPPLGQEGEILPPSGQQVDIPPAPGPIGDIPSASNLPVEIPPVSNLPEEIPPVSNLPEEIPPAANLPEEIPPASNLPGEIPPASNLPNEIPPVSNLPEEIPPVSNLPEEIPPTSDQLGGNLPIPPPPAPPQ